MLFGGVVEALVAGREAKEFPFLSRINAFFEDQALGIQQGGSEYASSKNWLNVWWQPDKLAFMESCREIDRFYDEARRLLAKVLRDKGVAVPAGWLDDAVALNKAL